MSELSASNNVQITPAPPVETSPALMALPDGEVTKIGKMEQRLQILETAVVKNAIELRDRVSERLERIERKLDDEVMRFTGESPQEAPDFIDVKIDNNVVVFPSSMMAANDRMVQHSATEFLSEFSETLSVTREHLEALTKSISKMRVELSS